ncbi:MAG: hypothetical protein AAGB34_10360, partial [Planctomycetota bacterium]
ANIWIMYVEPYRFGLSYPDPLHPTGEDTFIAVGELRPANEAGNEGVTFIEATAEDLDFSEFNIGTIEFDASTLAGSGLETVPVTEISLTLDGTEFKSTNRTEIIAGADFPPFGPGGRSNRNEAANRVDLSADGFDGTGLTFVDGILTSIDFEADATINTGGTAFPPNFGFEVTGTLTFSGASFAFDIDGTDSALFAQNVRIVLNRTGTIDAVGTFSILDGCPADFNNSGAVDAADLIDFVDAMAIHDADFNQDGMTDFFDLADFLAAVEEGCDGP